MKTEEAVIEELAKAGFEVHFDEKWDQLHPKSIERVIWKKTAKAMLDHLRVLWKLEKMRKRS